MAQDPVFDSYERVLLSQKAIGIAKLKSLFEFVSSLHGATRIVSLAGQTEEDVIERVKRSISYSRANHLGDTYLRSCPENPRPGVIENFKLERKPGPYPKELYEFIRAMLEAEPNGAIVIQPFIDADISAVWHGNSFVIGRGHDGVTAGNGAKLQLTATMVKARHLEQMKYWGYDYLNHEVEMIGRKDRGIDLVQIRASHAADQETSVMPGCHWGFSPFPSRQIGMFEHVLLVRGNDEILNAEKLAQSGKKDVLIIQLHGGPLSHWRGQALQYGWAYVSMDNVVERIPGREEVVDFRYSPMRQDVFITEIAKNNIRFSAAPQECSLEKFKVDHLMFRDQFLSGIRAGSEVVILNSRNNWSTWIPFMEFLTGESMNPETAYLAGFFSAILARSSHAICGGEQRHAVRMMSCKSFRNLNSAVDTVKWEEGNGLISWVEDYHDANLRTFIYEHVLTHGALSLQSRITMLRQLFLWRRMYSRNGWGGGYGGKSWKRITQQATKLIVAIMHEDIRAILATSNAMLNIAHNNGWAFGKFFDKDFLDYQSMMNRSDFPNHAEYMLDLIDGKYAKCEHEIGARDPSCMREVRRLIAGLDDEPFDRCPYCEKDKEHCYCEICPDCGCPLEDCPCDTCKYCEQKEDCCICDTCDECGHNIHECTCDEDEEEDEDDDEDDEDEEYEDKVENLDCVSASSTVIINTQVIQSNTDYSNVKVVPYLVVPEGFFEKEAKNG